MVLHVEQVTAWMYQTNDKIQSNKDYLSSLDQAIGDGDHGINMARGFEAVVSTIADTSYSTVSEVLQDVAKTLMSNVGGASGPLFGTAFLKLSMGTKGTEEVDYSTFVESMDQAVAGLQQRGKAEQGEKTMVDVWSSVAAYLHQQDDFHPKTLREIASSSMEETKGMIATKGRASYLKERSKGHLDPGSVSSYYIFTSLADSLEGKE